MSRRASCDTLWHRRVQTLRTILLGAAAAALLAVQITTARAPVRNTWAGGPAQITQTVTRRVAITDDDASNDPSQVGAEGAPRAELPVAPSRAWSQSGAAPGLIINATFDSTITSDPNAAAIENAINAAIADVQSMFSDPITVTINFKKMTSGLGQSSTYYYNLPYGTFLAALKSDASTSDDATAIARLPSVSANPVNGSSTINVKTANLKAVGFLPSLPPEDPFDGTISLNTSITTPGSPGTANLYFLIPVVEHEIDEVLGLGSSLPDVPSGTIFPEDLYRYDQNGARTFTTTSGVPAFFSIDGTTDLAQFNQSTSGDFGDWQSSPLPSGVAPKVQDAFATPGANPALSVEVTALDVIGYNRSAGAVPPSIILQPASQTIVFNTTAAMSVTAIGTAPLSYQWYIGASGVTTSPIGGATGSSFTTPTLTSTTNYWVRVSNAFGVANSATATVTVVTSATITAHPLHQTVAAGQNASFTVAAIGAPAPTYQWQVSTDGISWANLTNTAPYSGTGTSTLTVTATTPSLNKRRVRAVATNSGGSAASGAAILTVRTVAANFDGDGKTDLAIYRPDTGVWWLLQSSAGFTSYATFRWGLPSDIPVPGDYDGDGKTDVAVFRPDTGVWWLLRSSTNFTSYATFRWGLPSDIPIPGDYDGDGKTDIAVYRPDTGVWWLLQSSTNFTTFGTVQWGVPGDIPVSGDFDGDGKTDIAVYRPDTGVWWILQSGTNFTSYVTYRWGLPTDVPVPGDYDGDGKTDIAVYRPDTGVWWILQSSTNFTAFAQLQWGQAGDVPVPGDYDGDGKTDIVVYRPDTGVWSLLQSSTNFISPVTLRWGQSGDIPILKRP
jgi:hypothetical protein